ncbi:MAG: hypothetical protein A2561_01105 [Candidatus Staskawiczbacteria bacterium RIFOXYD1_FULL_32_13]|uniref:ADP-ribosylglycohydrolase n=1 Tax=Candidatus Staskawiczbacteria bacterium RIFOXYD1_FULL_32_13 TaxID=1802234 RepID=A0A1G2JL93_9BACT|nr:MAG: hypothetical protein A2561_01105 [Candidatus Staskawiczbacteria bacterium RIFOXYD1_FULL_32_13]
MVILRSATTPDLSKKETPPDLRGEGHRYFTKSYGPSSYPRDPVLDKFLGCILWGAYGDAAGMPFETIAPLDIYNRNGKAWVTGLTAPKNSFASFLKLGGWTDDTQLTIALMEAFVETGSWDMNVIAKHHVRSLGIGARGWGGSTRESVMRLRSGVPWNKSGKPGGSGNGIPMKIGSAGLYFGMVYSDEIKAGTFKLSSLANIVKNISIMTHRDSRAVTAGIFQSILIALAMNDVDPMSKWDQIMDYTIKVEKQLPDMGETLSSRLEFIPDNLHRDVEYFAHLYRTGCYVIESYPFSVACYLKYRKNAHEGVLAAVNAGGDCDTTAAIVGNLCGAEAGIGDDAMELVKDVEQYHNIVGLVNAFYNSIRNGMQLQTP